MALPRSFKPAYNRLARIKNIKIRLENMDKDMDRINFAKVFDVKEEWKAALAKYRAVKVKGR
jgi:hypothetical protein